MCGVGGVSFYNEGIRGLGTDHIVVSCPVYEIPAAIRCGANGAAFSHHVGAVACDCASFSGITEDRYCAWIAFYDTEIVNVPPMAVGSTFIFKSYPDCVALICIDVNPHVSPTATVGIVFPNFRSVMARIGSPRLI